MPRHATLIMFAVALAACGGEDGVTDLRAPRADRTVGGIAYSAETLVMESFPVQLRPIVTLRNATGDEVTVQFPDGCHVLLRAYRDPSREGAPAWDQSRTVACIQVIQERTLAPGDTAVLTGVSTSAAEILGDSLPAGRCYFTALVRPNGQQLELAAGEAELAY